MISNISQLLNTFLVVVIVVQTSESNSDVVKNIKLRPTAEHIENLRFVVIILINR